MTFERIAPEQHDTLEGIAEPSENPVLVGHTEAVATVAGAYRSGKLPHAMLLAGPRGIGKATLAYHVAHHLLSHPVAEQRPRYACHPRSGFVPVPTDRHGRASGDPALDPAIQRQD